MDAVIDKQFTPEPVDAGPGDSRRWRSSSGRPAARRQRALAAGVGAALADDNRARATHPVRQGAGHARARDRRRGGARPRQARRREPGAGAEDRARDPWNPRRARHRSGRAHRRHRRAARPARGRRRRSPRPRVRRPRPRLPRSAPSGSHDGRHRARRRERVRPRIHLGRHAVARGARAWGSGPATPSCRTWPGRSCTTWASAIRGRGRIARWDTRPRPPPATGRSLQGNVGAGTGATVGKLHGAQHAMRGGLGCATTDLGEATLGAIVAVNAVGDVRDPATGRLIAGTRDAPDGRRLIDTAAALAAGAPPPSFQPVNTTIGVVVTSAALDKNEAARLARLGDGRLRASALAAPSRHGRRHALLSLGGRRRGPTSPRSAARRLTWSRRRSSTPSVPRPRCPACRLPGPVRGPDDQRSGLARDRPGAPVSRPRHGVAGVNPDVVGAIARLRADGVLSAEQAALFDRVARRRLVSVRLEIKALLYVGVLLHDVGRRAAPRGAPPGDRAAGHRGRDRRRGRGLPLLGRSQGGALLVGRGPVSERRLRLRAPARSPAPRLGPRLHRGGVHRAGSSLGAPSPGRRGRLPRGRLSVGLADDPRARAHDARRLAWRLRRTRLRLALAERRRSTCASTPSSWARSTSSPRGSPCG